MTTRMWGRVVGLLSLCAAAVLLTVGCTTTPSPAPHSSSTAPVAEGVSVTAPTEGDVPAGIAAQQYGSVFNTGNLWVGAWWADPQVLKQARKKMTGGIGGDSKYPYGMKYTTWKVLDGKITGEGGKPRISVKSLDGRGRGSGNVGAYTSALMDDGTMAYWWPTVVGFTSHGCWQITETQGDERLVYVVKI